jgi:hypothetical protein
MARVTSLARWLQRRGLRGAPPVGTNSRASSERLTTERTAPAASDQRSGRDSRLEVGLAGTSSILGGRRGALKRRPSNDRPALLSTGRSMGVHRKLRLEASRVRGSGGPFDGNSGNHAGRWPELGRESGDLSPAALVRRVRTPRTPPSRRARTRRASSRFCRCPTGRSGLRPGEGPNPSLDRRPPRAEPARIPRRRRIPRP